MTTGPFHEALEEYCRELNLPMKIEFVQNPRFAETNYIYSIHCAREHLLDGDILLLHGDLVFDSAALDLVLNCTHSCMVVSGALALPEKDFKAVLRGGRIEAVGVDRFDSAVAAQPMYKLFNRDWLIWLERIDAFCAAGRTAGYAEDALNEVSGACDIRPMDVGRILCQEVDTPEDLQTLTAALSAVQDSTVYMCFSTDVVHSGHIKIIQRARRLGKLVIGVMSDEAVAGYRRFPLIPFAERKALFESIDGVDRVVEQRSLSYAENLRALRPSYVVHGDDWRQGFQRPIRDEVEAVLAEFGGRLMEYPYAKGQAYDEIESRARSQLCIPDDRRGRLRKLLALKPCLSVIEAHSGITGLIAENTVVYQDGAAYQFDAMWVSSLCDSTARGKPDIELVDLSSRLRTVDDIMEVTTKPIILDGDTGGQVEHFSYNVRTLERIGVSAIIVEDKTGLKKNSLFGTEVEQTQESVERFATKISAGKRAQKTQEFMIIARIESLILDRGMDDALLRARAYVEAGADGIMIHSRRRDPSEIFEFVERFRAADPVTPLVVVPTSFNAVPEREFARRGVNIVIYANQLTRSAFPAMQSAARSILTHHRAMEADQLCMPIADIITLIPEE